MSRVSYYPVFLNLRNKSCFVIGGGRVAERKVLSLLKSGAKVTVISPEITGRLEKEKSRRSIRHISRRYKKCDLRNAFLVISATDSGETNKKVSKDAPNLINVVDTPALCNFIVPSIVRRGPLAIAISTSGASPSMAKAIRKELGKFYPPEFGKYLASLKKIRAKALIEIKDIKKRESHLKGLATGKTLKRLRENLKIILP